MINVSRPDNKMGSLPIESSTLRNPSSIVVSTHIPSMKEVFLAQLASQSIPIDPSFPVPEFFGHCEQISSVNSAARLSNSTPIKNSTSHTTSSVVPLASVDTLLPGHRTFLADPHSFNRTLNHSPGVRTSNFNGGLCSCGICPDCRNYTDNSADFTNDSSAISPVCSASPANDLKNVELPDGKTHGTCATTLLYNLSEQKLLKRTGKDPRPLPVSERTVTLLQQPLGGEGCTAITTTTTANGTSNIVASPSSDVLFASAAVHSRGDTATSTEYQNSQFLTSAPAPEGLVSLLPHAESTNVTAQNYPDVCSSTTETVLPDISVSPPAKISRPEVSTTVPSPLQTVTTLPVHLNSSASRLSSHLPRSASSSCHQTTARFILPSKTTREVLDAPSTTTAAAITPQQVHLISLPPPPTSHGPNYIPTSTLKTAVPASTSLLCVNAQMLSSGGASFVLLPIAAASLMQSLSPAISQAKTIESPAGEQQTDTAEPIDSRAQLLFLQASGKEQPRSRTSVDLQPSESPKVVLQQSCSSGRIPVTPSTDLLDANSGDCPISAPFASSASDSECAKTPLLPPLSSLSFSHASGHENSAVHFEDRQQTVLPSAAHLLAPKSSSSSELLASLTTAKTASVLKPEQSASEGGGGAGFTPRKRHQCPFCAKTCERKDNLQAHIHPPSMMPPCLFRPRWCSSDCHIPMPVVPSVTKSCPVLYLCNTSPRRSRITDCIRVPCLPPTAVFSGPPGWICRAGAYRDAPELED
nr:unnamed protein product [Spirometra erinaceieuropaei]